MNQKSLLGCASIVLSCGLWYNQKWRAVSLIPLMNLHVSTKYPLVVSKRLIDTIGPNIGCAFDLILCNSSLGHYAETNQFWWSAHFTHLLIIELVNFGGIPHTSKPVIQKERAANRFFCPPTILLGLCDIRLVSTAIKWLRNILISGTRTNMPTSVCITLCFLTTCSFCFRPIHWQPLSSHCWCCLYTWGWARGDTVWTQTYKKQFSQLFGSWKKISPRA